MRSIFTKMFLWFWLSLIGVTVCVTLLTIVSGSQPLGRPWIALTMRACARGAVDVYLEGGAPALTRYMDDLSGHAPIRAALLDPEGQDILGRGVPNIDPELLRSAREQRRLQLGMSPRWSGAEVVPTERGDYIFIAEIHPLRALWRQRPTGSLAFRFAIALFATAIFCALLTRHLTRPIRALQSAARLIADGDLAVRATPAIAPRSDELAELAQDFDRMAERIEALLKKQQEMLGDISHDLRSPLTRLNVSLELVRRGDRDAIARMQQDLDRLDEMIAQILTLTRLQVSEPKKSEDRVNLHVVIESVVIDANFEAEEQGKSVALTHEDDCWIDGDPALLRSCIENVVRNAVRYTKPNTEVAVSLDQVRNGGSTYAVIKVTDHGDGVPPEALPRLFEPFYRVSTARESTSGGFGLGLAIAHRVAILHSGSISASNRPNHGLEMTLTFPCPSQSTIRNRAPQVISESDC